MCRKIFNVPTLQLRMNQVLLTDWVACIVTDAFGMMVWMSNCIYIISVGWVLMFMHYSGLQFALAYELISLTSSFCFELFSLQVASFASCFRLRVAHIYEFPFVMRSITASAIPASPYTAIDRQS